MSGEDHFQFVDDFDVRAALHDVLCDQSGGIGQEFGFVEHRVGGGEAFERGDDGFIFRAGDVQGFGTFDFFLGRDCEGSHTADGQSARLEKFGEGEQVVALSRCERREQFQ